MATGTDFWAGSDMCKHESICVSMNMNKKILPALLLAVCCWAGASAQQVAVKTNLLYWAAATPNVGAEVAVGKMQGGKKGGFGGFKLPFIGDKVFKGLQTNYYKGSFVGAGISIGYQFYVSPHWNLELSAGAGLARLSYHAEPVRGPKRSSYVDSKRFLPIPTEIGVTFVYLFNSKK